MALEDGCAIFWQRVYASTSICLWKNWVWEQTGLGQWRKSHTSCVTYVGFAALGADAIIIYAMPAWKPQ